MRRVRRIRAGPADRPARLLRALRAPASRPGVRRNRRLQRERDPRLQGYGPGLPGVRRQIPVDPRRPPGSGARTLRDHGTVGLGERPAHARPHSVPRAGGWPARLRRRGGRDGVGTVAIAHNGNLTNTTELMAEILASSGNDLRGELGRGSSTDTAVMTALLGAVDAPSLQDAALSFLPRLKGAFSLAFMDETTLYAARDRHGFRPLVLGRLEGDGPSPRRRRPWTSSVRTSCAKSPPASSWSSTPAACAP